MGWWKSAFPVRLQPSARRGEVWGVLSVLGAVGMDAVRALTQRQTQPPSTAGVRLIQMPCGLAVARRQPCSRWMHAERQAGMAESAELCGAQVRGKLLSRRTPRAVCLSFGAIQCGAGPQLGSPHWPTCRCRQASLSVLHPVYGGAALFPELGFGSA